MSAQKEKMTARVADDIAFEDAKKNAPKEYGNMEIWFKWGEQRYSVPFAVFSEINA